MMSGSDPGIATRTVKPSWTRMRSLLLAAGLTLVGAMALSVVELLPEGAVFAARPAPVLSPAATMAAAAEPATAAGATESGRASSEADGSGAAGEAAGLTAGVASIDSVQGLSLYDRFDQVIAKKGMPYDVQKDPDAAGLYTYRYPSMDVGFADGSLLFVAVPAEVGTLTVNGRPVPLTIDALRQLLGEPDYWAEDGLVFQRRDALIKLFIDPVTQELLSVNYYHITSA